MVTALEGVFFLFQMLELAFEVFLAQENLLLQTLEFKLRGVCLLLQARFRLIPRVLCFQEGLTNLALGLSFRVLEHLAHTLLCRMSLPLGRNALSYVTEAEPHPGCDDHD